MSYVYSKTSFEQGTSTHSLLLQNTNPLKKSLSIFSTTMLKNPYLTLIPHKPNAELTTVCLHSQLLYYDLVKQNTLF